MFTRIPGNLSEDSGKCYYFNIPGNDRKDSGECSKRFRGMFEKDSWEQSKRFRGMFQKIPGNVSKDFLYRIRAREQEGGYISYDISSLVQVLTRKNIGVISHDKKCVTSFLSCDKCVVCRSRPTNIKKNVRKRISFINFLLSFISVGQKKKKLILTFVICHVLGRGTFAVV